MHPSLLAASLLLTALTSAGCGDGPRTSNVGDDRSVLYVASRREGPEIYYTEGAVEAIHLIDAEGDEIAAEGDPADPSTTWVDLPAGDYTLSAEVRPCDGNCGLLDPPTDSCRSALSMAGHGPTHVTVTFHYGRACRIEVDNLQ